MSSTSISYVGGLEWVVTDRVARSLSDRSWRWGPLWKLGRYWLLVVERTPEYYGYAVVPVWLAPLWLIRRAQHEINTFLLLPTFAFLHSHGLINVPEVPFRMTPWDWLSHLWFLPAGRREGPWWKSTIEWCERRHREAEISNRDFHRRVHAAYKRGFEAGLVRARATTFSALRTAAKEAGYERLLADFDKWEETSDLTEELRLYGISSQEVEA